MNPIQRLGRSIRSLATRAVNYFGKSGGGFFSALSFLSGSNRNWSKEAGPRYDNSAVFAAYQYLQRKITGEPRLIVQKQVVQKDGTAKWVESPHELPRVVRKGSIMSGDMLISGAILSLIVSGDGYWIKDRLPNGRVAGFVYVPHWQMKPVRDRPSPFGDRFNDGTSLVTFYEFRNPDGTLIPFRVEDVVHFKWGIDPARPEHGLSPIFASLRGIVTDNTAATLGAALLDNAGIPGVAISPKNDAGDQTLTDKQREELNTKFARRISGDMAGTPFIAPFPVDFTLIGHSPDKLVLKETRAMARAEILAPLGIDPMVLGFPSEQKTYSNFEEALRAGWRSACKPVLRLISETLDEQVYQVDYLPSAASGDATTRVYWDLSEVPEEQDDKYKEAEMVREDWKASGIKLRQYQEARGYEVDTANGEKYYNDMKPMQEKVVTDPAAVKKALTMAAREKVPLMKEYEATMEGE